MLFVKHVSAAPSGSCGSVAKYYIVNAGVDIGKKYYCSAGTWTQDTSGGGSSLTLLTESGGKLKPSADFLGTSASGLVVESKNGTDVNVCSDDTSTALGDGIRACLVLDPANSDYHFFADGAQVSWNFDGFITTTGGSALAGAVVTGTFESRGTTSVGDGGAGAKAIAFNGSIDGNLTWSQTGDTNADGTVGEFQLDKITVPQAGIAFAQEKGIEWAATSANSSGADPTNMAIFTTQPADAHDNDGDSVPDTENMLCVGENMKATTAGNCSTRKNTSKSAFYQQFDTAAQSGSRYGEWYLKATSPAGTAFEWFDIHSYHENATPVATFTYRTAAAHIAMQLNDTYTCFNAACGTSGNTSSTQFVGTADFTGDVNLRTSVKAVFEGATDDASETTVTVTDPTADRTITLPNATGSVPLLESNQTWTGTNTFNKPITVADQAQALGDPGNRIDLPPNDITLTVDSTCASCTTGHLCIGDSDESASRVWDICSGSSLVLRIPATDTATTKALFATATAGAPAFRDMVDADVPNTITTAPLYSETTGVTVANTVSATALVSAGQGSLTVPANTITNGGNLALKFGGVYGMTASSPTMRLEVLVGGATVLDSGTVTPSAVGATAQSWYGTADIVCRAAPGASVACIGTGYAQFQRSTSAPVNMGLSTAGTFNLATNGSLAVSLRWTWGTASATNTITSNTVVMTYQGF